MLFICTFQLFVFKFFSAKRKCTYFCYGNLRDSAKKIKLFSLCKYMQKLCEFSWELNIREDRIINTWTSGLSDFRCTHQRYIVSPIMRYLPYIDRRKIPNGTPKFALCNVLTWCGLFELKINCDLIYLVYKVAASIANVVEH